MKKLPSLTAKQVIRILKRLGFQEDRQKGSHLVLLSNYEKKNCCTNSSWKDYQETSFEIDNRKRYRNNNRRIFEIALITKKEGNDLNSI